MSKLTKCDQCKLPKTPIIYLRTSRKLCVLCWKAETETAKSLISVLPEVKDEEPPLGYHFIVNDWFPNPKAGKKYADYIYSKFSVCSS